MSSFCIKKHCSFLSYIKIPTDLVGDLFSNPNKKHAALYPSCGLPVHFGACNHFQMLRCRCRCLETKWLRAYRREEGDVFCVSIWKRCLSVNNCEYTLYCMKYVELYVYSAPYKYINYTTTNSITTYIMRIYIYRVNKYMHLVNNYICTLQIISIYCIL